MLSPRRFWASVIFSASIGCSFAPATVAVDNESSSIFSTPDAQVAPPSFSGRAKVADTYNSLLGPNSEPPNADDIKAVPSLSAKQRSQIDDLYRRQRTSVQAVRDEMGSLNRLLQNQKLAKPASLPSPEAMQGQQADMQGLMAAGSYMQQQGPNADDANLLESPELLKAHMEALKQQITGANWQLWQQVLAVLTPQQLNEFMDMRHGTLVINSNASTNVPEPISKAPAKPAEPFHAAPPTPPHPYIPSPAHVSPYDSQLINSTKRLLWNTLLRL